MVRKNSLLLCVLLFIISSSAFSSDEDWIRPFKCTDETGDTYTWGGFYDDFKTDIVDERHKWRCFSSKKRQPLTCVTADEGKSVLVSVDLDHGFVDIYFLDAGKDYLSPSWNSRWSITCTEE